MCENVREAFFWCNFPRDTWKEHHEKYDRSDNHSEKKYKQGEDEQGEDEPLTNVPSIKEILDIHDLKKKELPKDIQECILHFDKSEWKKLSIKYHPDKNSGDSAYSSLLSGIKDHYEPNDATSDETWTK